MSIWGTVLDHRAANYPALVSHLQIIHAMLGALTGGRWVEHYLTFPSKSGTPICTQLHPKNESLLAEQARPPDVG
jgi:hypothetical protein